MHLNSVNDSRKANKLTVNRRDALMPLCIDVPLQHYSVNLPVGHERRMSLSLI